MNVEEPGEVGTVERVGKMFPVKLVFGFAQHEASYVMGGGATANGPSSTAIGRWTPFSLMDSQNIP